MRAVAAGARGNSGDAACSTRGCRPRILRQAVWRGPRPPPRKCLGRDRQDDRACRLWPELGRLPAVHWRCPMTHFVSAARPSIWGLCPQTPEVFRLGGIRMGLASSSAQHYLGEARSEDRALLRSNPSAAAGGKTDGAGPSGPASSHSSDSPRSLHSPSATNPHPNWGSTLRARGGGPSPAATDARGYRGGAFRWDCDSFGGQEERGDRLRLQYRVGGNALASRVVRSQAGRAACKRSRS